MKIKLTITLFILCISCNTHAVPSTLTATSQPPFSSLPDFTISFNDTGDGLFELTELISFSGFTFLGNGLFYDRLTGVPDIADVSVGSVSNWQFVSVSGNSGLGVRNDVWKYEISINNVSVPEPTSMALLGLGILGLGWTRRKKNS